MSAPFHCQTINFLYAAFHFKNKKLKIIIIFCAYEIDYNFDVSDWKIEKPATSDNMKIEFRSVQIQDTDIFSWLLINFI